MGGMVIDAWLEPKIVSRTLVGVCVGTAGVGVGVLTTTAGLLFR